VQWGKLNKTSFKNEKTLIFYTFPAVFPFRSPIDNRRKLYYNTNSNNLNGKETDS